MGATSFRTNQTTQAAHGVINVDIAAKPGASEKPVQASAEAGVHAVSTGAPPAPVVVHKTQAQVEAEAQSLAEAAAQLKIDAANVQPAA